MKTKKSIVISRAKFDAIRAAVLALAKDLAENRASADDLVTGLAGCADRAAAARDDASSAAVEANARVHAAFDAFDAFDALDARAAAAKAKARNRDLNAAIALAGSAILKPKS